MRRPIAIFGAVVVSMREQVLGDTRVQVIALMTAAAAIVLIACANLASLLLARASVRRGEYAVRLSLGATRGRLARQVSSEARARPPPAVCWVSRSRC